MFPLHVKNPLDNLADPVQRSILELWVLLRNPERQPSQYAITVLILPLIITVTFKPSHIPCIYLFIFTIRNILTSVFFFKCKIIDQQTIMTVKWKIKYQYLFLQI